MKYDFVRSVVPLVLIVAVATVALPAMTPMQLSTVMMMVLPSMVVFSVLAFFLGMKHGEFRTAR
ncbi:MAG: hypothetical protein ACI9CA_002006 [Natronomonas sp.]|jgi:hypothetical protein